MIELVTIATAFKQPKVVEIYERTGDTRIVWKFEVYPRGKHSELSSMQKIVVGPKDGSYIVVGPKDGSYTEGRREPYDALALATLGAKAALQLVKEKTTRYVGVTTVETTYYEAT